MMLATFLVSTAVDSGAGSLRQAILDSNASGGSNTIDFSIGSGSQTIQPVSPLPALTSSVVIDATTQPGFVGTPLITLDGVSAGGSADGFAVPSAGSNSTIKGFVINSFGGDAILIDGGRGVSVAGNYVGTNAAGTVAIPNVAGGVIVQGYGITIGGTAAGAGNLVSRAGIPGWLAPLGKSNGTRRLGSHGSFSRGFRLRFGDGFRAVRLRFTRDGRQRFLDLGWRGVRDGQQMLGGLELMLGLQPVGLVAPLRAAVFLPVQIRQMGDFITVDGYGIFHSRLA